jgi:ATP-dependent DNA ligase
MSRELRPRQRVSVSLPYITRNGNDWSDRYPGIVAAAAKLRCRS